jgi:uncharacterized damage-inducible protein DinB
MQPGSVVRGWQIDQLRKAITVIGRLVETTTAQDATTLREGGSGWTVLEVMCHLRDYEPLFIERVRLTIEQDFPPLPNPDPDQLAAENNYNAQDIAQALSAWRQAREAFIALLESVRDDETWVRTASHPRRGSMTLHDQLNLTVWHDMNHIEQMVKILNERG